MHKPKTLLRDCKRLNGALMRRPREHSGAAILEGLTSILPDRCWMVVKKRENFVADGKPHKVIPCEPLPPSPAKAQLIVSADLLRRAIKHDLNFDKKFFGFSQRPSVSGSVSQHTLYKVQLCETALHRALGGILRNLSLFSGTRFFSLWIHDMKADSFRGVSCGAIFVKTEMEENYKYRVRC